MKVQFQGREWELDLTDIDLKPAMVITGYTGMSINEFTDALTSDLAPDGKTVVKDAVDKPGFLKSIAAVYWLMLWQNGERTPIADVDFPLGAFSQAISEAQADGAESDSEPAEPEDPTLTSGQSSASSTEPLSPPQHLSQADAAEGSPDG